MSKFRTVRRDPSRPGARRTRRQGRLLIAGLTSVAGLAGVASLTGLHLVAANQILGDRFSHVAVGKVGNDVGGQGTVGKRGEGDGGQGDVGKGGEGDGGTPVDCDSNDLIKKLTLANAGSGGVLRLAYQCTYVLTANDGLGNGLPVIFKPITIKGNDATIVRAANAAEPAGFRIFNVGNAGDLRLKHLTVKGGKTGNAQGGGGILVQTGGALHITDSTVSHNTTTNLAKGGAAIANHGTTTVAHSTLSDNSTNARGGAIVSTGSLTVEDSQLTHNNASSGGGLAISSGVALISNSTVSNNNTPSGINGGGGIATFGGITTVNHSTISDNTTGIGGGIFSLGGSQFTLRHSTVDRNTSAYGGGGIAIYNFGELVIEDSAVTANTTGGNGGGIASATIFTNNKNQSIVTLRRSHISLNKAIGPHSIGGGIVTAHGSLSLTGTRVTENSSTIQAGGVQTNTKAVVDSESAIINNRPTNCLGSTQPVPNCFG
jgi:hypothetical protein